MIRKLGILVLIYGVLSQALQYLVTYLPFNTYDMASLFNFENVIKYEYRFRPDTSFLIVALVIFLLSYVFKYGEQLQRESDETL